MRHIGLALILLLCLVSVTFGARTLDGSSEWFARNSAFSEITDYPFTFAIWVKSDSQTASQTALFLGDVDTTDESYSIGLRGTHANDPAFILSRNLGQVYDHTTSSYTAGTWHHICGVFTNDTSRTIYIDGGNEATDANDTDYSSNMDSIGIGRDEDSAPTLYFDGAVAEAGVWDKALSGAEIDNLYTDKYAPGLVAAGNLVAWWKLDESAGANNAIDQQGSYTLTQNGSPGATAHPPGIRYTLTVPLLHAIKNQ